MGRATRAPRTRLEQLVQLSNRSQQEHCDDFNRVAKENDEPTANLSLRQFKRWLKNDVGEPWPANNRVAELCWGEPFDALMGPPLPAETPSVMPVPLSGSTELAAPMEARPVITTSASPVNESLPAPEVQDLVAASAIQSAKFGQWADAVAVGDSTMELLWLRVKHLATGYVHWPMVQVFRDLVDLRDELFGLLGRPDPRRVRDLYLLAGITCGLLAQASDDLGDSHAAEIQAGTALICADRAGHPTLAAWIFGVRALQHEWAGECEVSVGFVRQARDHLGREHQPSTVAVWVDAIEARALATAGAADQMNQALRRVDANRQRVNSAPGRRNLFDELGGMLTFSPAKQLFYSGGAYRRIGAAPLAAEHATAAILAYRAAPEQDRSYGDLALAGIDLAIARVQAKDLTGASAALVELRTLPSELCLPIMVGPLQELSQCTSLRGALGSPQAAEINDTVAAVVARCNGPVQLEG